MTAATPGTAVTSVNPNNQINVSLTVTLASTTVGALNVIEITGDAAGTGVVASMNTPTGWTLLDQHDDTNAGTGSSSSHVGIYWRVYQSGDPLTVAVTWTNAGQMVAVCTPFTGQGDSTPLPYSVTAEKATSDANYTIGGTTGTDPGLLCYGFANRSSTAWSGLGDNARATATSGVTMVSRITSAEVAGGTAFTKTAVGTSTSIGVSWAYVVKGASGAVPGSTALSGTGALTTVAAPAMSGPAALSGAGSLAAAGSPTVPDGAALSGSGSLGAVGSVTPVGAAALSGAGTLAGTGAPAEAAPAMLSGLGSLSTGTSLTATATATLAGTGTLAASALTRLQQWLAAPPYYIAHRGGDNDWPEMTRYAYTQAVANGAKALNVDGVKCSTGEFVASHDATTGRVFGTNYTIASTSWSTLSTLTTTVGGYPIEKVPDLLAAFPSSIWFAENKGNSSDDTAWFNMLDANGGKAQIVAKQYYTASAVATDAHARGYTTWGYYYAADLTNLSSTQASWDILGLDYTDTNTSDWTTIKSYGKKVLGHVIPSAAGATQAFGLGADGIMTGKVLGVIPGATVTGSAALTGAGILTAVPSSIHASGAAALAGTGTLTGTGSPTIPGTAALSGTGSLATIGAMAASSAAALAGTGTLAASTTANVSATAALAGAGTLAATFTPGVSIGATLTGVGALTTGDAPSTSVTATLAGAGVLATSGTGGSGAQSVLSGTGTLATVGRATLATGATLSGAGALTAATIAAMASDAVFTGLGNLVAATSPSLTGAVPLAGLGALLATGTASGGSVPTLGVPPITVTSTSVAARVSGGSASQIRVTGSVSALVTAR